MDKKIRFRTLVVLGVLGIGISLLTAFMDRVESLSAFCGIFGGGCIDTSGSEIFAVPLWLWGIIFYTLLILGSFLFRHLVFLLVSIGVGVEIVLIGILVKMGWFCIFCVINAVIIAFIAALSFKKQHVWQSATIALMAFIFGYYFLLVDKPFLSPVREIRVGNGNIAASVGDVNITPQELESPLATNIYRMNQQIYKLKKRRLEALIDKTLLEKEAGKKGVSVKGLILSITSGKNPVSDSQVDQYIKKNKSRLESLKGTDEEFRENIRTYLTDKKNRRFIRDHLALLRIKYKVAVYLEEPPLPFSNVRIEGSKTIGSADAPVTIVEFSDYMCSACKKAHEVTNKIKEKYNGQIRWVFKDYPLTRHKGSKFLAQAAYCAGDQGKFWEFQDKLFNAKKKPDFSQLKQYAKSLNIDENLFSSCLNKNQYLSNIEKNIADARESGVNSTPTFVINGKLHPGRLSFGEFSKVIDKELEKVESSH